VHALTGRVLGTGRIIELRNFGRDAHVTQGEESRFTDNTNFMMNSICLSSAWRMPALNRLATVCVSGM
jgi:hypothetical protein